MWKLLLCIIIFTSSPRNPKKFLLNEYHINGTAQGTTYHITYYAPNACITKVQTDSIFRKLDSSLSIYKPYSLINQFNASVTYVEMDQHFSNVIKKSIEIYRTTHGLFDITVYPLVSAWGFGQRSIATPPDSAEINKLLPCIGTEKLYIKRNKLYKRLPCVKIDVNGIAQGYSIDVIAGFLEGQGVLNYVAELGGEIRVSGKKPGGAIFQIGIEGPAKHAADEPEIRKILSLTSGAITTSGNYRKYYMNGNKKITHIINPQTGYSIQNEMISTTIYAKKAITADGYDNALLTMGLKGAFKFMNRHKEMEAYFIFRQPDGSIADTATAGFPKFYTQQSPTIFE